MRIRDLAVRPLAVVIALWCSCWTVSCQATERSSSYLAALESIGAEDLRQHVYYLADDALEGREAGTKGGRQAADYLREQLGNLQLSGAGVDGGFFQPFSPNFRNVLALLRGNDPELSSQVVIVSAHYDHVGYGTKENSAGPIGEIHNGADDNASGTSALLELAEAFSRLPQPPRRSVLFAAWDAEEMEMLGSRHWIDRPTIPLDRVAAVLNLDMIGRLRDNRLTVYGTRTGYGFRRLVSRQNDRLGLGIDFSWELEDDADHYPFFQRGTPVLFLHTGLHDEFHSPADDAELINGEGMERVVRLAFHVLHDLAQRPREPRFRRAAGRETEKLRSQLAEYTPKLPDRLGAGWSRWPEDGRGVRLLRVGVNSPAAEADIRAGDRIVRFADHEIRSGEDLTAAVMLAEHRVPVVVRRPIRAEPLKLTVELAGNPMRLGITWRVDDAEPGTIILTHVVPGSPAAGAGMRPGDRIYQVAGEDFADQEAFVELLRNRSDLLELLVEREGQLRTVVLDLGGRPGKRAA